MRVGAARDDAQGAAGHAGEYGPTGSLLDEGRTSGGVDQPVVEGDASPEPGGPKRLPLGVEVERSPNGDSGNGRTCEAAAGDIRPIHVSFDAEHDGTLLDLRANGAADHSATDVEAVAVESGRDHVERVLLAPTPAAVHTDIEARPIVNRRRDRGRRRLDSEISRMRRERAQQRGRASEIFQNAFH